MDQNNFNEQGFDNASSEMREELPVFEFQPQTPVFEQEYAQEASNPEVEECVNGAFGKALASVIMVNFPIVSLVSVILGALALKGVKKADELAAAYGVEAGGKRTAAKIMGMIGTIYGAVITCYYALIIGIYGCAIIATLVSELS
ncbi:MAG: hypothetical protein IJ274_03060 [Lachnospiraceae bacterium]|nr:hypothetical protein [Lachnospiraceae bacterium]